MDERLSPSARLVQSPGDNPSTIHSIEAILGFKEDTIFHKSASFSMTEKVLIKDAERNVIVTPMKKSHSSESFDSKWPSFHQTPVSKQSRKMYTLQCWKPLDNFLPLSQEN